jgi:hypothetical protein
MFSYLADICVCIAGLVQTINQGQTHVENMSVSVACLTLHVQHVVLEATLPVCAACGEAQDIKPSLMKSIKLS